MRTDYDDKNVAYTTDRKDTLSEFQKMKTLFEGWFGQPVTTTARGRDYDTALMSIVNKELHLRAAKVDWQATRADDRAYAKRQAQDAGLEPHFQDFTGFDLKRHWHIKRRELSPTVLFDYDPLMMKSQTEGKRYERPAQFTLRIHEGWNAKQTHDKDETLRWKLARDITRAPVDQKGGLDSCFTIKENWQSKLTKYPEATAKFA
ncbi:hypothetical protein DIPPA_63575 [Diplonema papillatum]|nr:hypothetical protein DIPPA_63575 [Diplonema papillatum]